MIKKENKEIIETYKRYPLSYILIYNGLTVIHFLLGGMGIIYGYNFTGAGKLIGYFYLAFAFVQMYIVMPLKVCPACVYHSKNKARCISGLNIISKRVMHCQKTKDLSKRGKGLLCHNHLYIVALVIPVIFMLHALVFNFSFFLLFLLLVIISMLLLRILIIFPKMACIHCMANDKCPNAEAMGIF